MCGRGRSPPACGRAICRSGRRRAGPRCPRRGPALRRRTSAAPVGLPSAKTSCVAVALQRAALEFVEHCAQLVERSARFLPPRAPPWPPHRGPQAVRGVRAAFARGGRVARAGDRRAARAKPERRARSGETVDRLLADERVDTGLGIEGEQVARAACFARTAFMHI